MKEATIARIKEAAYYNRSIVIGKYTYKANLNTGDIMRCKTDDIGREWLTWDGRVRSAWEVVDSLCKEV